MARTAPRSRLATHDVTNQPPERGCGNLFASDPALRSAARRIGQWAEQPLLALGEAVGTEEVPDWAVQANRHAPELVSFDHRGQRFDEVRFHPACHALMALAMTHRIAAIAWDGPAGGSGAGAAIDRAARGRACRRPPGPRGAGRDRRRLLRDAVGRGGRTRLRHPAPGLRPPGHSQPDRRRNGLSSSGAGRGIRPRRPALRSADGLSSPSRPGPWRRRAPRDARAARDRTGPRRSARISSSY